MGKNKSQQPGQIIAFRDTAFISAVLVTLVLLMFWPLQHCGFLNYDDDGYVTNNPHVLSGLDSTNAAWAFYTFDTANWHPLTWLSLMFDAQLFGNNPATFHLTNLFLHAINTVLLFILLTQMTGKRWRSAFVAALFGLHPLHVESVAWISERKDVLSGLFFLLALLAYVQFVEQSKVNSQKSKIFYALTLLSFASGLMSKPMLVTLPFILLLLDFWPLQRFSSSTISRLIFEKIPFFLLSAISCVVTFIAQKHGETVQTLAAFPMNMRIENAFISYLSYLEKTFWPVNLAVPYPYSSHSAAEILLAGVLVVGISGASLFQARKFPFFFIGWFWFLGMLIPVIGLVQVGRQAMADRYAYLPLIGIFIAVSWGIGQALQRIHFPKILIAVAMISILIVCAFQTRKQITYWQNSETLFQHAIAVTKNNAEAYDHLGTYYLRNRNQVPDAENCYEKAVELAPDRASSRVNLGSVFLLEGKTDAAADQFNAALHLAPENAEANCDLGYICASRGQFDEAIALYDKAIQSKPNFSSAYHNRGLAFAAENNWTNAILDFHAAIRLDPNHASTHKHLGIALIHEGQTNEAIAELNCALQLNPNDAETAQQLQSLQK